MKRINKNTAILISTFIYFLGLLPAFADAIVMSNSQTLSGNIVQTNGDDVLILTRYAAFDFSKSSIKEIKTEADDRGESSNTNRLPNFQNTILFLSQQSWAKNLSPIPATVIDKGILRNVPYTSFRCASDYEINIYGDLDNPSGIEIGLYHNLIDDNAAKNNCINFISNLLSQSSDKKIVQALDLDKDLITRNDLTFEITPPTAEDSYNGWWISVYSEKQLNLARASADDMKLISMTQADAAKDAKESTNYSSWSADELKQARPSPQATISFMNTSGEMITNAEVVRVIDGVSLIWRNGDTSEGMIRLADLPKKLRVRFGYDEAKTKAADDLAAANKARWQQEANAAAQAQAQNNSLVDDLSSYADSFGSDGGYSGGGSVYVHGYTRSNGTYVHSYYRSR